MSIGITDDQLTCNATGHTAQRDEAPKTPGASFSGQTPGATSRRGGTIMQDRERVRHNKSGGGPAPTGNGSTPVITCSQHGTMRTGGTCSQCQATAKVSRQIELEAG
jgi:hypothetical protein